MEKLNKLFVFITSFFIAIVVGFGIFTLICIKQIDENALKCVKEPLNKPVSTILTNDNKIIPSSYVNLDEIKDYTKNAFIAVEDQDFYKHNGFNYKRLTKAVFVNLFSGQLKQGASTISQQLVKNLYLTNTKTAKRKIQELYLTAKLETHHTKEEILESYLNSIYFGCGAYGIENASLTYFNKHVKDLDVNESAVLAGIIKSPAVFNPLNNYENAFERKNFVLENMLKQGFIDKKTYNENLNKKIETFKNLNIKTNSFLKQSFDEMAHILDSKDKEMLNNYKIYTYLDFDIQEKIRNKLKTRLSSLNNKIDFCVVVLNNENGGVLSLISSKESQIKRQPGSLIKPILCYAPAFELGILTPASPVLDSQMSFDDWSPKNIDDSFDGFISCRDAIVQSKNIPAIKTLDYVGIDNAKKYLEKMNIKFNNEDNHLALALGAMKNGITPLEMASCYSTFANNGKFLGYHFIKRIEDENKQLVFENIPNPINVFNEETCYLVNDVLHDCTRLGTAKKLGNLPLTLSAKTGTVGNSYDDTNTDAWCCSYNKNFTVCVWFGNTSTNKMNNLSKNQNGGTICCNVCKDVFEILLEYKNSWFEKPENVEKIKFDLDYYNNKHKLVVASEEALDINTFSDYINSKYKSKIQTIIKNYNLKETKKEKESSLQKIIKNWFLKCDNFVT